MSFFGEFRKLFFGAKSVAKSGTEKVVKKGKEVGEDLVDKSEDLFDFGKEKVSDVAEKVGNKFEDIKEKSADFFEDVSEKFSKNETVQKTGDFTEKVGGVVKEKGGEALDKFGEVSEKVGGIVMEKGGEAMEKFGEVSEKVGDKVMDIKDKVMDKAEDAMEMLKDKYDETYEKAKKLKEQEDLEGDSEIADTPLDAGGSLIDDTDDFFSRAEKFAEGDYKGNARPTEPVELPSEEPKALPPDNDAPILLDAPDSITKDIPKAAGFDDLDGDGNEIIDDAIVIEDNNMQSDSNDAAETHEGEDAKKDNKDA